MPLRKWVESANNAIEGILYAAKSQRHVRYHLYAASVILLLSFLLGVNRGEFLIICLISVMVIVAEMINSAIEVVVDMVMPGPSERARIIKDMAAGAVLIAAFGSIVIGYIILLPYLERAVKEGIRITKHSAEDIAIIALVVVLILVVITKSHFGKGHPLRGGLPSGHAAMAFSIWVSVSYISSNFIVSLLTFVTALVIAQSRVAVRVHTPWEVFLGAAIGSLITFILFSIFY
ncbi:MAG TPA: phosphatase PAP2 family protein [Nitrospirae bacterium]|nr:phosphatase PAP2 family protein [Nitrospirota bacterium]